MEQAAEITARYERKKDENRVNNLRHAERGVEFADIDAAYIAQNVRIDPGVRIGPGVTIEGETEIGADCVIGQGCFLENARIGAGCVIGQNSEIIDSSVGDGSDVLQSVLKESVAGKAVSIGPFAYLRPGSEVGDRAKIGDFVEIKNARVGEDTKISHLTYVGDADIGKDVNIGCGVVFVNYDGREKHRSVVGDDAFVGCNVNLISPVRVGDGAYIAAGTTVTCDIPAGSLGVGRPKGRVIEGWVKRRGLLREKSKTERKGR
ncbi:MAG: UDP-N-acetylglucosamine diphosphorylase [Clostridiales Family XIII bacterium]|jgi:bifunctional UDP-N-acetylglucosamine pyrophosphorylase/glucosamine-1-phosphate N-acetyltransferase|nr:UDP-N-acetylglucosamine diphosphorylase [Clostridiales Family XIII bacterium]